MVPINENNPIETPRCQKTFTANGTCRQLHIHIKMIFQFSDNFKNCRVPLLNPLLITILFIYILFTLKYEYLLHSCEKNNKSNKKEYTYIYQLYNVASIIEASVFICLKKMLNNYNTLFYMCQ